MEGGRRQRTFLVQPLAIEGLAETPSRIATAKGLEPHCLLFIRPLPVLWRRRCGLDASESRAGGRGVLCREESRLDALKEDLVVDAGLGATAEGDNGVHEVGVLGRPLKALACTHRPAGYAAEVGDVELLREEGVLGADVVVEGHVGKRRD